MSNPILLTVLSLLYLVVAWKVYDRIYRIVNTAKNPALNSYSTDHPLRAKVVNWVLALFWPAVAAAVVFDMLFPRA